MIFKNVGPLEHRVVFTTEFGNKLFDFSMLDGELTSNFIPDDLDRKIIKDLLRKDFELLLTQTWTGDRSYSSTDGPVTRSKQLKGRQYLYMNADDELLLRIVQRGVIRDQVVLEFLSQSSESATQVVINHVAKPLLIELTLLDNQPK